MIHGWFTIVAQVINFLILVWLLRKFLYKPILDAIDAREKGIADHLSLAEAKLAEAEKEREEYRRKSDAIDQQRDSLLATARDDAKTERQRLIDEARKEADDVRAKRQEALRNQQTNLNGAIVRWTRHEVFSITRKTLQDLANTGLEQQMIDVFLDKLRNLGEDERAALASALQSPDHDLHIRSAFDPSPDQRLALESAVKFLLAAEATVHFTTIPDLVSGIELSTGGRRIAWCVADYLATLEHDAANLLVSEMIPGTSTK